MKKFLLMTLLTVFAMFANASNPQQQDVRDGDEYHYEWNQYQYSNNMGVSLYIVLDGVEQETTDLEIGFFYNGLCRGRERLSDMYYPSPIEHYFAEVTVNGENGMVITDFRLYDHSTNQELDVTCTGHPDIVFQNDSNIGNLFDLQVFTFTTNDPQTTYYTITTVANPTDAGLLTGSGSYEENATCTLTATPATGYQFDNWMKNSQVVSTDATYEFTVTENATYTASFSALTFTLTATANPADGGVTSGGGSYEYNTIHYISATANPGYHFVNWTLEGDTVSILTEIPVLVTEALEYVANFDVNSYEINATANPTAGGTVSGADTYNYLEECTLTATANTGYHFVSWKKNGQVVSTDANYTFQVTGDASYVANFELNVYSITATVSPENSGTVSGAGNYTHGSSCTLEATPATGYHFVNWTKNGQVVYSEATYTFTATEEGAYVANFAINSYDITATVNPANAGTVSGTGNHDHFSTCTLVATPATGYHFVNWTKNGQAVSNNATYSFEVTEAAAYVANFELNSYDITATVNPENTGTVSGTGSHDHFSTCTLVATPATGYHFVNWTLNGQEVSTNANYSFTVSGPAAYVAHFAINNYTISTTVNPANAGTVTGAGSYDHFSTCTLEATPATGYHFANWTKNGQVVSSEATYEFTVTEAATYVANFTVNSYDITASVDPANSGTVSGTGSHNHFSTCTLVATPATGYHFVNWTLDDQVVSSNASYSFTVSGPAAYVAHFELNVYEITTTANPANMGSVSNGGTYTHGNTCTLIATAFETFHFVSWTLNGEVVSTNATYVFTVTNGGNYVANFSPDSFPITATANPANAGTINGTGEYDLGSTCTLTATPAVGYHFVNWTLNGQVVSTDASYTFTPIEAGAYVANFALNSYQITASVIPAETGTVSGTGSYNHFSTCTLVATPAPGYHFVSWKKNGQVVSYNATYEFTVTGDAFYVAHFQLNSYAIVAAVSPLGGGTVTGAGMHDHFTTCTLTATANEGYHFVNWTQNGEVVSTNPTYSFTVTGPAAYVAHFAVNTYNITVTAEPADYGTVYGGGTYEEGSTCTLAAIAANGYYFVNWTLNGVEVSTNATYSFTVTGSANYVAHFRQNGTVITGVAFPAAGGVITGSGTYDLGSTCTLTATANEGYTFVNWTRNGIVVSTSATYTFTVTEFGTYVAHFQANSYMITVSAEPANGGTVSGGGQYFYSSTCTLHANPNPGYMFVCWVRGEEVVSVDADYSFTVTGNATYKAMFIASTYQITATVDPAEGGTITGAGTYELGTTAILSVDLAQGYEFVNWTENGEVVSEEQTYSFLVAANRNLVAHVRYVEGIDENDSIILSAYPNPASDKLTIEVSEAGCLLQVYSITGALIYSQDNCSEKVELPVSELPAGVYVIRMTGNNAVQTTQFMKN